MKKYIFLALYTLLFKHFPISSLPIIGPISKSLRYLCCKNIFKKCGQNVNIERKASFGTGFNLEIGDNSGLGRFCHIPSNIIIGNDVMMGPHVFILDLNHEFNETIKPMRLQGFRNSQRTVIDDDVWIGMQVIMTPGRHIRRGSIIGAGTVLTKDFPEFSIIGGNPSKLLKRRSESREDV